MLLLSPLILILLGLITQISLRLIRPRFSIYWLLGVFSTFAAWGMFVFLRLRLPLVELMENWQNGLLLFPSPLFLLDQISWPYIIAFETVCLTFTVSAVVRGQRQEESRNWSSWSTSLIINLAGILSLLAGNLLAILLTWTLTDLFELIIRLRYSFSGQPVRRILGFFTIRAFSLFLIIGSASNSGAASLEHISANSNSLSLLSSQNVTMLLIACWIRLAGLTILQPEVSLSNSGGTSVPGGTVVSGLHLLLIMMSASVSLALITRLSFIDISFQSLNLSLILLSLVAALSALLWATAPIAQTGQIAWFLSIGSLSVISGFVGQPAASLIWGLSALLIGGLIFIISAKSKIIMILSFVGWVALSSLPYTPTWQHVRLYNLQTGWLNNVITILILLSHSLLLAGYLRHIMQSKPSIDGLERWTWIIYPIGGFLILLVMVFITYWSPLKIPPGKIADPDLSVSWPVLVSLVMSVILYIISKRFINILPRLFSTLNNIISLSWTYQPARIGDRILNSMVRGVDSLLEGPGGILWTILLLTILITYLL